MLKGVTLDRFNRDKEPVALTLVEPGGRGSIGRYGLVRPVPSP